MVLFRALPFLLICSSRFLAYGSNTFRKHKPTCGESGDPRIVGGVDAKTGEFPWQISFQYRSNISNNFHQICGASLLNERWAITAAHCFEKVEDPSDNVQLVLGANDFADVKEKRLPVFIDIAAIHPLYDSKTQDYDLALLRLREPVKIDKYQVSPICLPDPSDVKYYEDGKNATVIGWGRTEQDNPKLPSKLQKAVVPFIDKTRCEEMARKAENDYTIADVAFCAGYAGGGIDSCQGDSGGPIMVKGSKDRWSLAGIVSWGIGCGKPNLPGVYVKVAKFVDWINDIIIL